MKTIINTIINIPIISTFIISLVFFGLGVYETISGIVALFQGKIHTDIRPGIILFQALDVFLIGFLFLIFSIGFVQLFASENSKIKNAITSWIPNWLIVTSFTQLKLILWDTVLTTLVVLFAGEAFRRLNEEYNWTLLFIPIAILLISISKFLIKKER